MRSITFTKAPFAALLAVGLGVALATPVAAQEGPPLGCYARHYSQAHLEAHPDQIVESLYLWMQDQTYETTTDRFAYLVVQFAAQGHVARNGHGAPKLDQSLICYETDDGRKGCSVECDGGYFWVAKDTGTSLTIATDYLLVGDTEGCGGVIDLAEVQGQEVKYRLDKVDEALCLGQVEN